MYIKPLKIGDVEIKNNIFLAPMAGVTDIAFRSICKDFGVGMLYTEMASSKAVNFYAHFCFKEKRIHQVNTWWLQCTLFVRSYSSPAASNE